MMLARVNYTPKPSRRRGRERKMYNAPRREVRHAHNACATRPRNARATHSTRTTQHTHKRYMHYGLARFTALTLAVAFGAGNCAAAGVAGFRGEVMPMGYVTSLAETMLGREDEE